ncbi:transcriptional regulator NrdR [Arachnia propionica]|uniref:Transcriptional repressor NrdR n=1 Tax=Arachnia propionica TaxID=1750 RepID=A0A3P1WSS4_9ACTN|nr:transcriptional regulator NrdR [Arachnia propionica]RRD49311.1 transcriptional repressor NrdR [Arachnia propionica]
MHCPFCRHEDTKVSDSRVTDDGLAIRRRRNCPTCCRKFTTIEQIQLSVVKRSGVVEAFSRDKIIKGVGKACQGRPVTPAQLAALGQRVEETLRSSGHAEIPSEEIGVAILGPLAELDPVAYLRFASVYKNYDSVDDFTAEIAAMKNRAPEHLSESGPRPGGRARTRRTKTEPSESQQPLIG